MTKNLFPQFLHEVISCNFNTVCAAAVMMDMEELGRHLPQTLTNTSHQEWFAPFELELLDAFKYEKRRLEWFAGRICAKMATADFLLSQYSIKPQMNEIIIDRRPSGRPCVVTPDHQLPSGEWDLSISHSGRYAVALAAAALCGVDIQEPRQTLLRVKDKFCSGEEISLLQDVMIDESKLPALTLLWAAKEAIRKAYSLHFIPGFLQLKLDSAEANNNGWMRISFQHNDINPTVICGFYQDYGAAICIERGLPSAGIT